MSGAVTVVSNNTLATVARCTTEDVLRYGFNLTGPDERAELRAGQAAHAAIAAHFRGKPERMVTLTFDSEYEEWARANVPSDDRLAFENVRAIVRRWAKRTPIEQLPFKVEQTEVKFNFEIEPGVRLMGVIDALVRDASGEVQPLENKTTGSWITGEKWPRQFAFESQLTGYAWATGRATGRMPSAVWVNALQFSKLPSSDRRCYKHAVKFSECGVLHAEFRVLGPIARRPSAIASWEREAVALARRHARNLERYRTLEDVQARAPQEGRFAGRCTFCTYFKFCAAGRQPRHARSMLVEMDTREVFAEGMESRPAEPTPALTPNVKRKPYPTEV